jgi:nucleoside-diphosphate-sugar epimerase
LTAIVTGAYGISGYFMVRALGQAPQRWAKIYCLSRRPPAIPGGLPSNAEHIPLDFLQQPGEIADVLRERGVKKVDYVFFFSYVQIPPPEPGAKLWSNAEEMCRVNTSLLSNFLDALPLAGLKPERVMLQTGAKNYGLHLGSTALPQEETDPRVHLEANFYYTQEDYLWAYCAKHAIGWNICMPSFILGAVPDAAMNVCYPLAVYAAVTRHMGAKLEYPGDLRSWEAPQVQSSAIMNAYLEEWAVLTEEARDQKFNAFDDSAFTWGKFWPKLARLYGVEFVGPGVEGEGLTEVAAKHEIPPRG